jgi:hypothetical protein
MVAHREREKEAPNLSAEDGTENTASCMERQIDRQTDKQNNAEGRQRTNMEDIVAMAQFQVEMGRPCSKNGPALMGTSYIHVRKKNNGAIEDQKDRHAQKCSSGTKVTKSEKPERVKQIHAIAAKLRRHKQKSGYTNVLSKASSNLPERSEILLYVPNVHCDIS